MINGGNNGGGNPNHAADGKFTSGPNQAGNKVEEKKDYESQVKEKLGIKNDSNPSFEEKMQNTMGIKQPEKPKNPIETAKEELQQNGYLVVGEDGDRVTEVTSDGEKLYAKTYRTNYDGPIESTEDELWFKDANGNTIEAFDSLEDILAALQKDGYAVYDDFKVKSESEMSPEETAYEEQKKQKGGFSSSDAFKTFESRIKDAGDETDRRSFMHELFKAKDDGLISNREFNFLQAVYFAKHRMKEDFDFHKEAEKVLSRMKDIPNNISDSNNYEQKVQSTMGINNPEPPEEDDDESEEMEDLYAHDEDDKTPGSVVYYAIKNKAGETTYYQTYKGEIQKDSKLPPQGEETIIPVTYDDFDSMLESGKVRFKNGGK